MLRELQPLLHLETTSVTGETLRARLEGEPDWVDRRVVRPLAEPLSAVGGLVALFGSLAPGGAILKRSAADARLFEHEGRAVVFESLEDLAARVDHPELDVTPDDVFVLQNAGPKSGTGMPEAGYLPIPATLARAGVKDMIRISDARMSGTAFGTIVLHVTPESAIGGPLGLVRSGDRIRLSVAERRLDLLVSEAELARRRAASPVHARRPRAATPSSTRIASCRRIWAATSISCGRPRRAEGSPFPPAVPLALRRGSRRCPPPLRRVQAVPCPDGWLRATARRNRSSSSGALALLGRASARGSCGLHPGVPKADHCHGPRDRIGEIEERVQQVHRLLPHDASTEILVNGTTLRTAPKGQSKSAGIYIDVTSKCATPCRKYSKSLGEIQSIRRAQACAPVPIDEGWRLPGVGKPERGSVDDTPGC